MHSWAVCAVSAPANAAAAASLRGAIGGVSSRSSHQWNCAAAGRSGPVAVTGVERLLLRGLCSTPNAVWRSVEGKVRIPLLGTNHKRWVVQSSNSEQGQEILEEKDIQSSEENNSSPPVLTIIAGLLVLFVIFWALGSLVSWIVGLFLRS